MDNTTALMTTLSKLRNSLKSHLTMTLKIVIAGTLALSMHRCAYLGIPVDGTGEIITAKRAAKPFHQIVARGNLELVLVADSVHSITLETHENLVPHIITDVHNGRLSIATRVPLRSSRPSRLTVALPEISKLELSQFGTVTTSGELQADQFTTTIRNSGSVALSINAKVVSAFLTDTDMVRIKGTTHTLETRLNGRATLDSRALSATVGRVYVYGPSKCSVFASKVLFARVDGPGEITYYGQPEALDRHVLGPGQITAGVAFPLN